jgi:lipoyl(octanoyl) transferase
VVVKDLGLIKYGEALAQMQAFSDTRTADTPDELWLCEHPPVFTLGRHADAKHILNAHNIPIAHTDRGGQVTYHGPGQLMVYCLFDLKRKKKGIAEFVCELEAGIIRVLKDFGINAACEKGRPGVYVDHAKICSIGLRVKHGCTYHGLALNINMDLKPFGDINPCGYENLAVTQIANFAPDVTIQQVRAAILYVLSG